MIFASGLASSAMNTRIPNKLAWCSAEIEQYDVTEWEPAFLRPVREFYSSLLRRQVFVLFINFHLVTTRPEPIYRSKSQISGHVWWHPEDAWVWLLAQHFTSKRGTDAEPITKPKPGLSRNRLRASKFLFSTGELSPSPRGLDRLRSGSLQANLSLIV